MATDEELVRAFAGGDRSALEALARHHERALLDLALAILGSRDLALDVVQEVWLRVVRYAGSFNGRSTAKTWLYRIAINQCRSAMAAHPLVSPAEADLTPTGVTDPAEIAASADEGERLKRLVEALSPPLREVVLLCYTHGLTHSEAAEAMGIPLGTVKSRLNAALEQLRRALAGDKGGGNHESERH